VFNSCCCASLKDGEGIRGGGAARTCGVSGDVGRDKKDQDEQEKPRPPSSPASHHASAQPYLSVCWPRSMRLLELRAGVGTSVVGPTKQPIRAQLIVNIGL
jgi:hypothetical protein